MKKKLSMVLALCLLVQALGLAAMAEESVEVFVESADAAVEEETAEVVEAVEEEAAEEAVKKAVEEAAAEEAVKKAVEEAAAAEAARKAAEEAAAAEAAKEAAEEAAAAEAAKKAAEEAAAAEAVKKAAEEVAAEEAAKKAAEEAAAAEAAKKAAEEAVAAEAARKAAEEAAAAEAAKKAAEEAAAAEVAKKAAEEAAAAEAAKQAEEEIVEESFKAHLVHLDAGKMIYDGAECYQRQGHETAEDAVALAVESLESETILKIQYALENGVKTGYVKASDAAEVADTDAYQQENGHVVEIGGYYLENVLFVEDEETIPVIEEEETSLVSEEEETVLVSEEEETELTEIIDVSVSKENEESDDEQQADETEDSEEVVEEEPAETEPAEKDEEAIIIETVTVEVETVTEDAALAAKTSDDDFVINAAGIITEYTGTDTDIIIPEKVNGITVTGISETAFARDTSITSILINQAIGLNWIQKGSFEGCTSLKSVSLANSPLTVIQDDVFKGCTSLSAISWPNGLTSIGDSAFEGCTSLTGVALPATVTSIGNSAFRNNTALLKLKLQDNSAGITIGAYAFSGCTKLDSIYLPNTVTDVGNSAFENCSSATTLSLSTGMQEIKNFSFGGCSSLTMITIPNGVKDIGREAFYNCSKVKDVIIPASVGTIGTRAFDGLASGFSIFVYPRSVILSTDALGSNNWIYAYKNSTGHEYAKNHDIKDFIPMEFVDFVDQTYRGILNRAGKYTELRDQSYYLKIRTLTGGKLTQNLLESTEYANRNLSYTDAVKAVYKGMLNRSVDSAALSAGVNNMNNGVSIFYIAAGVLGSDEYYNRCIAYEVRQGEVELKQYRDKSITTTAFVVRCYRELLGRTFDVDGLNHWCEQLLKGKQYGASIVGSFIRSKEFASMNLSDSDAVEKLYKAMMGRNSDAGKTYWLNMMAEGVSIDRIAYEFVKSPEFEFLCQSYLIYPGTLTLVQSRDVNVDLTKFVVRCYTKALDRAYDVGGVNYWTNLILTKKQTPKSTAANFVFSAEARMKNLNNSDFVKMLYRLYMGREFDTAGLNHWLGRMSNGMTREQVAAAFADSKEFSDIVASYGLT